MKKIKLLAVSSLCLFFILNGCRSKREENIVSPIPVKVQAVNFSSNVGLNDYVGVIAAESSIALSFSVAGTVDEVLVNEGEQVKKGQLLARLNANQLQNSYTIAKTKLLQAEDAFKRLDMLYKNNSLPEIKYIDVKSKLEEARSVEAIALKNLNDCSLFSPISGVIGSRDIEPGMNAIPGGPVFTVLNVKSVDAKFPVSGKEISKINIGQPVFINISALGDKKYKGVIREKSAIASRLSHAYDVKAKITDADKDIMPGMACQVRLNLDSGNIGNVITIPNNAVQVSYDGKRFVWIVSDGRAQQRFIHTGNFTDYDVVVSSGLNVGDSVIIQGYHKVSKNMKVEVNL